MTVESDDAGATVKDICVAHAGFEGPLLPILHEIQNSIGYISDQVLQLVADELNMSRAEVFGVMTFYHDFRRKPRATHTLRVCRAEACQAVGGRELWAAASGAQKPDSVSVEPVYCLGNCACAPSVQIDGRTLGHMDVARVSALLASSGETGIAS